MNNKNHIAYLDGVRGLAAIFVVFFHTTPLKEGNPTFWGFWKTNSYLSVDLFFLLSGIVLQRAYGEKLSAGLISQISFLKRRIRRLYPAFLLSCILAGAIAIITHVLHYGYISTDSVIKVIIATGFSAVLIPCIKSGFLFPLNPPYWSLFYEGISNILFGASKKLKKINIELALIPLFLILLAIILKKGEMSMGAFFTPAQITSGLLRSIFGILLGATLERRREFLEGVIPMLPPWASFSAVIIALAWPINIASQCACILSIFLIFPWALISLLNSKKPTEKVEKIMIWAGAISYPLYLIHYPLKNLCIAFFGDSITKCAPLSGILFLLTCFLISHIIHKKFEVPLISTKK
jgi:peptidoglycan/LPS O-acetylase OafA/YrhL